MADEGTTGGETGGGAGDTWTTALPEAIRGHDAFKDVKGVGDLATRYLDHHKPLAEQLPKEIAGEAAFKDLKTWPDLAKSYLSAQKMLGVPRDQLLRLPATDKPEDWAPVWDKLGRPAKAEDYKLEGEVDETTMKSLAGAAHGLGMSQKQLAGMHKWLVDSIGAQQEADQGKGQQVIDAAVNGLRAKWGNAYQQRLDDAFGVVNVYEKDYPGLKAALESSGLGNTVPVIELFAHLAAGMKEAGTLVGKSSGGFDLKSPNEAKQEIAALQGDKTFMEAYQQARHPQHKAAMERMTDLYRQAHPEAA